MPKISRRALLLSGAATVAASAAAGAVLWPYRPHLFERLGTTRFRLPKAALPLCSPGTLSAGAREAMRGYFDQLAGTLELPPLTSGEFTAVVNLKCEEAPSYLAAYQHFAASLPQGGAATEDFLSDLVERAVGGNEADAQSLRFVVYEFVWLQYARGGFREIGLTNAAGHSGGPNGYRLSVRNSKPTEPSVS
jgi:hypothetical protein